MISIRRWSMLLVVGLAALSVACGGSSAARWDARGIAESQDGAPFFPILVNSPLGLGANRLAVALTDEGALLSEAEITLRLYRLAEEPENAPESAELRDELITTPRSITVTTDHIHGDGTLHRHAGPRSTIYVANVEFDETGWWGVEIDVVLDGERHEGIRLSNSFVDEQTSEPGVGEQVPRSQQLTLRDVSDISEIDSTNPPNPAFHELTIAEALKTGKPVIVAFVTPAFCQTRFCGPVMEEVILPAHAEYGDAAVFVHVEPFDLEAARNGQLVSVPTVEEWGLLSEPFVFVLNADGTVAAKFEGIMEAEEVTAAVEQALAR